MSIAERPSSEKIVIAVVVGGLVLLAGVFFLSQRQQALRASPSGFDGLQVWLTANDVDAQNFLGGWRLDRDAVGLLMVPLFDSELDTPPRPPRRAAKRNCCFNRTKTITTSGRSWRSPTRCKLWSCSRNGAAACD